MKSKQYHSHSVMNNIINSIGILRFGALGDVCLTIPLVRILQKHLPHTKIYWVISRSFYPLVEGLSNVNFIIMDKPKSLIDYWYCYRQLQTYYFDVLLVPQATLRSNILCSLIKARVKYGYEKLHSRDFQRWFVNKTVSAKPEHLIESFLRFSEPFGIVDNEINWQLPLEKRDREWVKTQLASFSGKWIAICPCASKKERNWLGERYIATVNQLKKHWDFNVILIGSASPLEKTMAQVISEHLQTPCLNLVGKSSLKQLAALLSTVDVLLSPDTGPLHIAQAMGTPVVGLYAVASPEKTGPYFSERWVINKYPLAVKTILKKDPSKVSWHERVHSTEAMKLITVDEVVNKLEKLFSEIF